MNRRLFVTSLAFGGAGAALGWPCHAQETPGASVSIKVSPESRIAEIPANYSGLSYESAQLAHPEFFSPGNKTLIAFFRTLSPRGVLRIGGNSSEFTEWSPAGVVAQASGAAGVNPAGGPGGPGRRRTPVTPEAIRNLAAFLEATGWQLIYGLNLGRGAPERAAQEAKAVSESVGGRLVAFQIGNEPDLYYRPHRPHSLRPEGWDFDRYFSEWKEFFKAIRKVVPEAPFGAPDVVDRTDWIVDFAERGAKDIVLLSGHYYAEGPPSDPRMTIERLLERDPRLLANTPQIIEASRRCRRPFRMTEGNSCYNGGKRGVSDTFASALWAADYMLFLAQSGCVGVNFHGGGTGVYTPIASSPNAGFSARPIYYGLLLGEQFTGATMVETRGETQSRNVTAYAVKTRSGMRVAIFNKDEQHTVRASLKSGTSAHQARLWRLTAPAADSRAGVELAGAEVNSDGDWAAAREETIRGDHGTFTVGLPAASAAILFLQLST